MREGSAGEISNGLPEIRFESMKESSRSTAANLQQILDKHFEDCGGTLSSEELQIKLSVAKTRIDELIKGNVFGTSASFINKKNSRLIAKRSFIDDRGRHTENFIPSEKQVPEDNQDQVYDLESFLEAKFFENLISAALKGKDDEEFKKLFLEDMILEEE